MKCWENQKPNDDDDDDEEEDEKKWVQKIKNILIGWCEIERERQRQNIEREVNKEYLHHGESLTGLPDNFPIQQ